MVLSASALRLHRISQALFGLPAWEVGAIGLAAIGIGLAIYFGLRARRRD